MPKKNLLDDKFCVLVEFGNSSLAVGFISWLDKYYEEKELDKLMKNRTVVDINWPRDVDTCPAKKMMMVLSTFKDSDWGKEPVCILGYGDWVSMVAKLNLASERHVPSTTKEDRHIIMTRSKEKIKEPITKKRSSVKRRSVNASTKKDNSQSRKKQKLDKKLERPNQTVDKNIPAAESETEENSSQKRTKLDMQREIDSLKLRCQEMEQQLSIHKKVSTADEECEKLLEKVKVFRTTLQDMIITCQKCGNNQNMGESLMQVNSTTDVQERVPSPCYSEATVIVVRDKDISDREEVENDLDNEPKMETSGDPLDLVESSENFLDIPVHEINDENDGRSSPEIIELLSDNEDEPESKSKSNLDSSSEKFRKGFNYDGKAYAPSRKEGYANGSMMMGQRVQDDPTNLQKCLLNLLQAVLPPQKIPKF